MIRPARAATLLVSLVAVFLSCGPQRSQDESHKLLPDSTELFATGHFSVLRYFRRIEKESSPLSYDIWADENFASTYNAALRYQLDSERADLRQSLPIRRVTLDLRRPLTPERQALGRDFISSFEARLRCDLAGLKGTLQEAGEYKRGEKPVQFSCGEVLVEAGVVHNLTVDAEFLVLAFYDRRYFETEFQLR